ncbi:MAG: ATP-binding protein [Planctomycetia bacterium]|nr:ATP-binding protein [Planctomycetia bacterium]
MTPVGRAPICYFRDTEGIIMPDILIVDDNLSDQLALKDALRERRDCTYRCVRTGREALREIHDRQPSLILTDLLTEAEAPEINGVELLEAIQEDFPHIPVILVTSQQNEGEALLALRRGATNFVPKRFAERELSSTVHAVLLTAQKRSFEARLLRCVTHSRTVFVIPGDPRMVDSLVSHLQARIAALHFCDGREVLRLGVALQEAMANALYHGNLEISSELRGVDDNAYAKLVEERIRTPPYCERKIRVRALMDPDWLEIRIEDEGPGFDPELIPDPDDPANLDRSHGRGILLMRTFMDEVIFSPTGNIVTLRKRRNAVEEKEGR